MSDSDAGLDGQAVEATLLDADVLQPDDGEDLALRPSVELELDREFQRMANPNAERERLRALLGESADVPGDDLAAFEATETDDGFELRRDETVLGRWPSRTAFRVDLAVAGVLEAQVDDWTARSTAQRGELLSGARLFLESCPDCDGTLSLRTTSVADEESVGGETADGEAADAGGDADREVALLACEDCGEALFVGDTAA